MDQGIKNKDTKIPADLQWVETAAGGNRHDYLLN
jgi:hypothetical protein